jgi:hypothetical protein
MAAMKFAALHEPEIRFVDFQRLVQLRFMVPMRPRKRMEASHEPCSSEREFAHFRRRSEPTHVGCYQAWFMVPMHAQKRKEAFHQPKGRASSPLRADARNHVFLERKERRARSDAP